MPVPPATDAAHEVAHETAPATADPLSVPAVTNEPPVATGSTVEPNTHVPHIPTEDPAKEIATTTPTAAAALDTLPDYALHYAPIVYLDAKEQYFPGIPTSHVGLMRPQTFGGEKVEVPAEHLGKLSMLKLEHVNRPDVFLTMDDVRPTGGTSDHLKSVSGKPNKDGKSEAPVWIVLRDKTGLVEGEGTVEDVFYFFFYPYNLGNTVLFKHFGNHVGDWEHAMIRFRNGKPEAMHLSAHSDGNSWGWHCFEKNGERPVIYSAAGSHAMYPKKGTHDYSGVLLVGPSDHTSDGYLWDPTLNFVAARSFDTSADTSVNGPSCKFSHMTSPAHGFNKTFTDEDVVDVLSYEGRWGNSFSDLRKHGKTTELVLNALSDLDNKASSTISTLFQKMRLKKAAEDDGTTLRAAEEAVVQGEGPAAAAELHKEAKAGNNIMMISPYKRLLVLIWAEGPTGPRDKSLERHGMNRWKPGLLDKF